MRMASKLRSYLLIGGAAIALAACTQGEEIASPGASSAGGGATGGGSTGGGSTGGGSSATCPTGFTCNETVGDFLVAELSGTILTDRTLPYAPGVAYRLNGRLDVGIDAGADCAGTDTADLTIAPGVVIFGEDGGDYIVVNRCSKMFADGELNAPIIFTSRDDIERQAAAAAAGLPEDTGGSQTGEWGGLVVLGRAPINRCDSDMAVGGSAGCQTEVEGVENPTATYGGATSDDDSGIYRYVQVRFAGFPTSLDAELNGISFAGVGSDTIVDYVQVHNNSDDGIEMFGGTVNLKHIVLTGNDDESLDTDNGWVGKLQYMVINQRSDGADNAFEMSGALTDPGGVPVTPQTNPIIANFTMLMRSPRDKNAFSINTGHIGRFINGVIDQNNGRECINWASSAGNTVAGYQDGADPRFDSMLFDCDNGAMMPVVSPLAKGDTTAANDAIVGVNNNVIGQTSLNSKFFPGTEEMNVTEFASLSSLDPTFFEDTDYIGAFSPTDETPTDNWAAGWTFALLEQDCPAGTSATGVKYGRLVCSISGVKTGSITLTRGNFYELEGRVDVGFDRGADLSGPAGNAGTLTIEPGVVIFGNSGSDYLVVNRGSKIIADGTPAAPIIFTSEDDIDDPTRNDTDTTGEWGGLVVLGAAPINRCDSPMATGGTVGCVTDVEGVENPAASYGGATSDDDSGVMRYVQVKFAGFPTSLDAELNGISFAGVGSDTVVDYVQVHNNSDDGIEMFGGTVSLKHIVLTGNDDESLDTDNGWVGAAQHMIIVQRTAGADNGMEMSGALTDPGGVPIAPQTDPAIANFTMVMRSPRVKNAFSINTGHIGHFINGVIDQDNGQPCINWSSSAGNTTAGYQDGADPKFNSMLFDCGGAALATGDAAAAQAAIDFDAKNDDMFSNTLVNTFINGPSEMGAMPYTDTTLATVHPALEETTWVGAVQNASDRWWAGWSCGLESGSDC